MKKIRKEIVGIFSDSFRELLFSCDKGRARLSVDGQIRGRLSRQKILRGLRVCGPDRNARN